MYNFNTYAFILIILWPRIHGEAINAGLVWKKMQKAIQTPHSIWIMLKVFHIKCKLIFRVKQ